MIDLLAHIKGIFDKYKKDEVTVYAAQASFFIVIAFFPFIMLLLTVIQLVPGVQKSDLLSLLVNIMPDMFDPLVISIINDHKYHCLMVGSKGNAGDRKWFKPGV